MASTLTCLRFLDIALELLELKLCPIPIAPNGKKPLIKQWKPYQQRPPTEDEVRNWGRRWPNANIAVVTGSGSGVDCLDIDSPPAGWPPEGCPLPSGCVVRTPRGGYHRWFKHIEGSKNSASVLVDGVDYRGEGGYALIPGSVIDGEPYVYVQGSLVEALDTEPPGWLVKAVQNGRPRQCPSKRSSDNKDRIPKGQRNATLTSLAGTMHRRGMTEAAIVQALLVENIKRCDPPLEDEEVRRIADSVARYSPATNPEEDSNQRKRFISIATSGDELLTTEIARPESLLGDGLLTRGTLALLFGCPGVGKTWAALQLAHAIATGKGEWSGLPTGKARVGYLSLELPDFYLQQRLRAIAIEGECLEGLRLVYRPRLRGAVDLVQGDAPALAEWCREDELGLLILDPLSRVHRADENSAQEIAMVLGSLEQLCQETGTSVLLVHHERKTSGTARGGGSGKSELDQLRGSSRLQSDPTLIIHLAQSHKGISLTFPKPNLAAEPDPVHLNRTDKGPLELGEEPPDAKEAKRQRIESVLEFLEQHEDERFTTEQIMSGLPKPGVKKRTLLSYLEELRQDGRVDSIGPKRLRKWIASPKQGDVPF